MKHNKSDRETIAQCKAWYATWEDSGVFTLEQKLDMWFKILRENGVAF